FFREIAGMVPILLKRILADLESAVETRGGGWRRRIFNRQRIMDAKADHKGGADGTKEQGTVSHASMEMPHRPDFTPMEVRIAGRPGTAKTPPCDTASDCGRGSKAPDPAFAWGSTPGRGRRESARCRIS